jgi:NAD+ diphosphatase
MNKHSLSLADVSQAYWFVVCQGKLWLPQAEIPFGSWSEFGLTEPEQLCQIGEWQQQPCLLAVYQDQLSVPEHWQSARALLEHPQSHWFELAARATQFALFLQTHRYCGQCGSAMRLVSWELAMLCPQCGHRTYPRISPCVLVAIRKDDCILLARSNRHKPGFFSILAGFVESGETLEQAAVREVEEEVGVRVANLRYAGSQPWPFPHSLMMGFYADYVSGDIVCQPNEIVEAGWFKPDELPEIPPVQTLSGQMIRYLQQEFDKAQ